MNMPRNQADALPVPTERLTMKEARTMIHLHAPSGVVASISLRGGVPAQDQQAYAKLGREFADELRTRYEAHEQLLEALRALVETDPDTAAGRNMPAWPRNDRFVRARVLLSTYAPQP